MTLSPTSAPTVGPTTEIKGTRFPTSSPTICNDDPTWYFDSDNNIGCSALTSDELCDHFGDIEMNGKKASMACVSQHLVT